ncbi:MAG TPA: hypothetical protein VKY74_05990, partial [Chloroflexia bacterium]|nr:hypothetical protein [Chloroflexia bacterium]
AGKATLGAAGSAGKATLGAAGAVLGHTLPENVRQRGAAGILNPDGAMEIEEGDDPEADAAAAGAGAPNGNQIVDFDAPNRAPAPAAPFPLMRWVLPIAIVLLLAVLVFAVQGILSGQQTAKVDGLLAQAQQEELDSHDGPIDTQRDHLLKALALVQKARDIDPRATGVQSLAGRIQGEADTLNGITRLAGLTLLVDLSNASLTPGVSTPAVSAPTSGAGDLGSSAPVTDTPGLAPLLTPPQPGDYFSQVIVHDGNAFLLDKGSGRLYRFTISTTQLLPLLAPGDQVDLIGTVNQKARVGPLIFATWRPTTEGGDLAALDDSRTAYIWTPATETWQAFALGGADKLDRPLDMAAFDGNLYLLGAKPGQVSKWVAGGYNNPPLDWLSPAASSEVRSRKPVAMAVDGDIHLLAYDGRIITLSAGEVKNTIALPVWPQIAIPRAIFSTEASLSIYVVELAEKRIIRVDKATGAVQGQLEAPADSAAFDGLRNIYVDEAAGKIYVLSGKKLYAATLPSLPTAPGTAVPALPAANPGPTAAPTVPPTSTP